MSVRSPSSSWSSALAIALAVAALNVLVWAIANRPIDVPGWDGRVEGFAFSAFQRHQSPFARSYPSAAELERDVAIMARHARSIRTYAATESSLVPRVARGHGLRVMQGAWLDRRMDNNERELEALHRLVATYDNIDSAIVGNEALLRSDLTVAQLTAYLDRARAQLRVPVSTAEPWHVWLKYPELAEHVDFIAVHLLPYWEGIARRNALDEVLLRVRQLEQAFPGKRVVIAEVGWPSNGDRLRHARATLADEAQFLRRFFALAQREKLDYYVMEAFDQPWKEAGEGRVGAYWGLFDADRELKFELTGKVVEDPEWQWKALAAALLAFAPMLWFCRRHPRFALAGRVFMCLLVQAAATVLVWSVSVPFAFYLSTFDWIMLAILLPAQVAILGILLGNGYEFVEAIWNRTWRRRALPSPAALGDDAPFVSIHLACSNEPPEMVIATLDSLAALDYPAFEVLVVDNNTELDATWMPVEQRCRELGARFRFVRLPTWPGFKAGALNHALELTDPRAAIVGVVDADYVVDPSWLRALAPHFHDPQVAIVQCPQAHREFEHDAFRRMCNWEYEGFFRIGMHHRNERNAIIQHGTMTLIRREPLVRTGGWAQWSICEDAELGLRLFNEGLLAHYVDVPMGRGLTPADLTAYKSQRFRWAFGAMQILRRHFDWLVRPGRLTAGQRYHFLTGWFSWFADALHLVFTWLALAWSLGMLWAPEQFSLPLNLFLVPVLGFFVCKALFGIVLYRARVPCGWRDTLGAAIASMALSHTIARGIIKGLTSSEHPFTRTAKRRRLRKRPGAFRAVREEAFMLAGLVAMLVALPSTIDVGHVEAKLWLAILAAQALPYAATLVLAMVAARSRS